MQHADGVVPLQAITGTVDVAKIIANDVIFLNARRQR